MNKNELLDKLNSLRREFNDQISEIEDRISEIDQELVPTRKHLKVGDFLLFEYGTRGMIVEFHNNQPMAVIFSREVINGTTSKIISPEIIKLSSKQNYKIIGKFTDLKNHYSYKKTLTDDSNTINNWDVIISDSDIGYKFDTFKDTNYNLGYVHNCNFYYDKNNSFNSYILFSDNIVEYVGNLMGIIYEIDVNNTKHQFNEKTADDWMVV